MFVNWQDSSKLIPVVLEFRFDKRTVHVPVAELALLPLEQRKKVLGLITSASSIEFKMTHENVAEGRVGILAPSSARTDASD
jgi:hypothetical protein